MTSAQLDEILTILKSYSARLEKLEQFTGAGSKGSSSSSSSAGGSEAASVEALNEILDEHLNKFVTVSNDIGGEVAEISAIVEAGFKGLAALVKLASETKKPADSELPALFKSTILCHHAAAKEYLQKHNRSKVYNHLKAALDGLETLKWVGTPKPVPYLNAMVPSAEFSTNKILREFRGKDDRHVQWVKSFIALLKAQAPYVKEYHTTGVSWNRNGKAYSASSVPASTSTSSSSSSTKPKPKPKPSKAGSGAKSGLFAELNKGGKVTKGLKKVTDDMKTKNRTDRSGKVTVVKKAPKKTKWGSKAASSIPEKFELDGKVWRVEGYKQKKSGLNITETNAKMSANIYKCEHSLVKIDGKIGSVLIDGCKRTSVVIDVCVASIEVVNSSDIKIQVNGFVPTIAIDKVSGCQLFLSKQCIAPGNETSIISAKSSEMNVVFPQGDDVTEVPVPEQFVTKIIGNKAVTTQVDHGG